MTVIARAPLTDTLADWVAGVVGRPIGKLQTPADRPFPYGVMYSIDGGVYGGPPLVAPQADAETVWQFNAVALTPLDCESLMDAIRATILGRDASGAFTVPAPSIDGWVINDRRPDGSPGGVEYQGAPPKRVFTASERYVICVTPDT